jgi:hypothetical protein
MNDNEEFPLSHNSFDDKCQKLLRDFLSAITMAIDLIDSNESLKNTVSEQEQTITKLRGLIHGLQMELRDATRELNIYRNSHKD